MPGALLSDATGSFKPQLPNDTRWKSQMTCIQTHITNRPFVLFIVAQEEDIINQRISNLLHNVGLFNEAKHLKEQLMPIASALDYLQSDTETIADIREH